MLPYFKWGRLTHTQTKIQRAGFNYGAPHPPPWHVISCHFHRWLRGDPDLTWWGRCDSLLATQPHVWSCRAVGSWSCAWLGVGRARLLALRMLPAAVRSWVPVPAWQGWASCSLQQKAFEQFFVSLFLWKQRRKHPNTKYEGVKTTELGGGTVILTVKWASLDFHFKISSRNSPRTSVLYQCASIYFSEELCQNQQESKKHKI